MLKIFINLICSSTCLCTHQQWWSLWKMFIDQQGFSICCSTTVGHWEKLAVALRIQHHMTVVSKVKPCS